MPEISPELPAASAAPWCVAVPSSRMCEAVVSVFTASPSGSGWSWARVEDGFPESWHFGDNTHTLSLYKHVSYTVDIEPWNSCNQEESVWQLTPSQFMCVFPTFFSVPYVGMTIASDIGRFGARLRRGPVWGCCLPVGIFPQECLSEASNSFREKQPAFWLWKNYGIHHE